MAWKFRKFKIKWQKGNKRFKKRRINRENSRKSHLMWKKNKGKMMAALRKSKPKRMLANRKNKAKGMYKKLARARKTWRNILKSDVNLENFLDGRVFLQEDNVLFEEGPTLDLGIKDIDSIISVLNSIKNDNDWDDKEDKEFAQSFINDAIEYVSKFKSFDDLMDSEEDYLEEILIFIDKYAVMNDIYDELEDSEE